MVLCVTCFCQRKKQGIRLLSFSAKWIWTAYDNVNVSFCQAFLEMRTNVVFKYFILSPSTCHLTRVLIQCTCDIVLLYRINKSKSGKNVFNKHDFFSDGFIL